MRKKLNVLVHIIVDSMETIKCRPILVESNITAQTKPFSIGLTLCNDGKLRIGNPVGKSESRVELILISLENDNIEVGDMIYNKFNNSTFNHIHIQSTKHTDISDKKVTATQSQIPMTYIHQFIEEYNNNSVKDVDIEMETMNKGYNKPEDYPFQEIAIPKLTNGFITIVKERLFNQSDIDKSGIKLPDINSSEEAILYTKVLELCRNAYNLRTCDKYVRSTKSFDEWFKYTVIEKGINKYLNDSNIVYTEEEIKELVESYLFDLSSTYKEIPFRSWFEQNKKK